MDCKGLPFTPYLRHLLKLAVYLSFLAIAVSAQAQKSDFDKRLTRVSEDFFRQRIELTEDSELFTSSNPKRLYAHIQKLRSAGQEQAAASTVLRNLSTVIKNIDFEHTGEYLAILLEHNLRRSTAKVFEEINSYGSTYTKSAAMYQLAQHFYKRGDMSKTIHYLTSISDQEALTKPQQDYATILFGIALQNTKQHRKAIDIYEKVNSDSSYYAHAQLNAAVANIRQGWWTDAKIAVEKALEHKSANTHTDLNNRLLVVLGYSQLQNEFYRNARNLFRRINIDSQYANRALLGIGLCALHQKDYVGAINAFSRLQQKESDELAVIEAHLLVPYSYDRMGDLEKASEGYANAIDYFEGQQALLQAQRAALNIEASPQLIEHWQTDIDAVKLSNYQQLKSLANQTTNKKLLADIKQLQQELNKTLAAEITQALETRDTQLKSYISQVQYGLAKLYDSQ